MKFYGTFVKSKQKRQEKFKFITLITVDIPTISFVNKYSDDSLIRAPTVRKSRLSGQKVREPISFSGLMGVSVIRKTR